MDKPKIVVLLSRFPYPLEKGDKLRAYFQIKELSNEFSIMLICINENQPKENHMAELKQFCEEIIVFPLPKWKSWLSCIFAIFTDKPFQIAYFHTYFIQKKIDKIINRLQPNHIYCQLIRVAEYVKNYHECPKTIDYMDAFSSGISRRIPLVPFYYRLIFRIESKRLFEYEKQIYYYFEYHTIISEQDKKLIGLSAKQEIACVANGVSPVFFENFQGNSAQFDLVFVGNLNYPPNVEAVKFIVSEILPLAAKLGKKYSFLAAGAQPSPSLLHLAKKHSSFTLLANPIDIRMAYLKGRIFIAPMKIGTGLQNKLLESMALGIPSITTKLANNALHAKENEQILLADSAQEFVEKIEMLRNENLHNTLVFKGKKYIEENFNWKNTTAPLIQMIKKG